MPVVIAAPGKRRRKVRFPSTSHTVQVEKLATKSAGTNRLDSINFLQGFALREQGTKMAEATPHPTVPTLFTDRPVIRDALITETTELQDETVNKCLPFLNGSHDNLKGPLNRHGVPPLKRDEHIAYLYDSLEDYPSGFVVLDASRPWMVYWALTGLSLLGQDVTRFRERTISTFAPMQNPTGGFGGGHGQMSHCASTYAAVLSLAMVGGEEALSLIDRRAMWEWLGRLKQPDGGVRVCEGAEEDVRGAYCALVMISLLDLPLALPPKAKAREHGLETFTSGLSEYLSRCQTFEGGISGSPGSEAHGAYAFCALATLSILGQPEVTVPKCMDVPMLISWLSARQYAPEGGFAGRTNKLADGCYSHWVGSCWPLIQSTLNGPQGAADSQQNPIGNLYSREGLTRYILGCCQAKNGGLRDKPGKHPDSYHTCYTLTGLSTVQNHHYRADSSATSSELFAPAFSWTHRPARTSDDQSDANVFDESDRLTALHPLYVIPHKTVEDIRLWCEEKSLDV